MTFDLSIDFSRTSRVARQSTLLGRGGCYGNGDHADRRWRHGYRGSVERHHGVRPRDRRRALAEGITAASSSANGVALGWGKSSRSKGLEGRGRSTQRPARLWFRSLLNTPTEGVDIQPTVYGNMVFASSVPVSLRHLRGAATAAHALDQETGEVVWKFDTVDSPPGDVWAQPE